MTTTTTTTAIHTFPVTPEALAEIADQEGMTVKDTVRWVFTHEYVPQDVQDKAARILRAQIDETLARFTRVKEEQEDYAKPINKPKTGRQVKIFGHSVSAILRWMGANGFSHEEAATALADHGAWRTNDGTIRTQLAAGRDRVGVRGQHYIPELTRNQARQLKNSAN